MNKVDKKMDFDVYTDLKLKDAQYNVKIELENEVDSRVRQFAIAFSGTIVRNNFKKLYGKVLNDEELAKLIKDRLNSWMPKGVNFNALAVSTSLKPANKR